MGMVRVYGVLDSEVEKMKAELSLIIPNMNSVEVAVACKISLLIVCSDFYISWL